jgi:prephenate dehydrogenase
MADDDSFFLSRSKIAIIGLGLMGGSLALALRGKCATLFGVDPHQATLELACRQNIVDFADRDPAKLLPKADLVVLAAPVPAILMLLDQLPSLTSRRCIVMDLGSTKQLIVEAMSRLPDRFDPIGGHPICGKEKLSLASAERSLYYAAPFLLTPLKRTTPRALSAANQVIEAIGAKATLLDAAEHDRILASTSHLPFVLSCALALATPKDAGPFIGPGFRSVSRLAGTPTSMMLGILRSNRKNVLEALYRFRASLDKIEAALTSADDFQLQTLLNDSLAHLSDLITSP